MKNEFEQTRFTVETTKDGSPTLRLPNSGESMHHFAGAASETQYIYKKIIEQALKAQPDLKTCIVGLGLGYIEISWAISLLKLNLKPNLVRNFISFEIVDELKSNFVNWLNSSEPSIYDQILHFLDSEVSLLQVKQIILDNLQNFPLQSDFTKQTSRFSGFNLICYDAFSSKTNLELWSETFLQDFIKNSCAENCILTTYACTGVLKKVLTENEFTFIKRPGFQGKRDCSLALRGAFKSFGSVYQTF